MFMKKRLKPMINSIISKYYKGKKKMSYSILKKVIEKSLDSEKNFESIDNANAYYSERYGWTLRKI